MHPRYRLEAPIGTGGMGSIVRAYDRFTDAWVAFKQLKLVGEAKSQLSTSVASLRQALAEEFRILATLRHPYIVSVLDYGFLQGAAFFTMEFLPQAQPITLAAKDQPLATQLHILGQLLQALEYVRRHEVVHRDLKPDNVLVQHGQVKMLDFGLATLEGQQTKLTSGTLQYMAPETFDQHHTTHASDLFAVGVMSYEILAGVHPFGSDDINQLLMRLFTEEPDYTRLAGPEALRPVIARLLAKKPEARFATAAEALTALAVASGENLPLETQASRASLIQAAQLVGREGAVAQLEGALEQALAGQGRAVLVGGESGVGKSRLLEELRIKALVRGAWVWQGQAVSEGGQPAQLWLGILRWLALVAQPDELEAAVLKPFVPQLEALLERPVADAPALETNAAQTRFCSVVLALLQRVVAQQQLGVPQPLVLILEDLHWAGPLSRAVLAWIIRGLGELPLLIAATYRNDEQSHWLTELSPVTQLVLERLNSGQVAGLASAIFGRPAAQLQTLISFLYQQTEGNTFFIVEILRSLAEEAGLLGQVPAMQLPEHMLVGGMQQVIQRRLHRLAPADYAQLEIAAVVGRQLDLPLLQHLERSFDWQAWLSRCAETAVLEPEEATWRFAHDQLRQAVLAALPTERQAVLHLRVAAGIEQVYTNELAPQVGRLAYHYLHTNHIAKQRHYLWRAGQAAQATYDYAKALNYYEHLVPLLEAGPARVELYLSLGATQEVLGQWQAAEAAYQIALTEATTQQIPAALILSQLALGRLAQLRSDYKTALDQLAETRKLATLHHDEHALAKIHVEMGRLQGLRGELLQAQTELEAGVALARKQNDEPTLAFAMGLLGNVYYFQGNYAMTRTLFTESLALSQKIGDKHGAAVALVNMSRLSVNQGDLATAQIFCEAGLALQREIGDRYGMANALNVLGAVATQRHNYGAAQRAFTESLDLWHALGSKFGMAMVLCNLGMVAYLQGTDYQAALELYRKGLALYENFEDKLMLACGGLIGLAICYAKLGQVARATQIIAAAETWRQTMQLELDENEQQMYQATLSIGQATLTSTEFEAIWAKGAAMPLRIAIAYAVEEDP